MNKKILFSLGAMLLLLTVFISFFGIIKPTSISNTATEQAIQNNALKIAVVNEDKGTVYNGESINMANTLLHSFSNRSDYVVEEVSRAIAERGLENGTYHLMIILPSKFSEDSLALESSNPTKALFQYQIKSDKQLIVKQAEQAVLDFKGAFNKDLINVYFLSIIGNLQTAQSQVANVVSNEGTALNAYQLNLSAPLLAYSSQFKGVSSSPNDLLSSYSAFNNQLNQSNDAFTSIINVDKTYESEIEKIKLLQQSWQQSIDDKGKILSAYDEDISKLTVAEQLQKLQERHIYLSEHFNDPAIWKETTEKANAFNTELIRLIDQLKALNTKIDTTLSNYDGAINKAIDESVASVNDETQLTLGRYIQSMRQNMLSKIDRAVSNGVYYDDASLEQLGLSDADTQYLKNINQFISWYTTENKTVSVHTQSGTHVNQQIQNLKQSAIEQLQQQKTVSFNNTEGTIKEVRMVVPAGYYLHVVNHNATKQNDTTYVISTNGNASPLAIQYTLEPIDSQSINLIEPVEVKTEVITTEEFDVSSGELAPEVTRRSEIIPADPDDPNSQSTEIITETRTIKPNLSKKVIERTYTQSQVYSNLLSYASYEESRAFFKDIQSYLELSGLVKVFYDIDLRQSFTKASESSLFTQTDIKNLKAIIASLIKEVTLSELKNGLKVSEDTLKQFESKKVNGEELNGNITNLRTSTTDLMTQLTTVLSETEKIHQTLQNKPTFTETKVEDNTDLVTVSMDMNKDLIQLLIASRTLMDNTKSNQDISKTIQGSLDKLSADVTSLEQEGEKLSSRVNDLNRVMSEEYASNQQFLQAFSTVLSNTKTGNKTNDAVYEYLSNPVDATKIQGVLGITKSSDTVSTRQDDRSGLLIVLISYLVALTIAYIMQHADVSSLQNKLKTIRRVDSKNATGPLLFLSVVGGMAGLIIGVVAAIKLDMNFGQGFLFSILVILMLLTFTYGLNALLSKVKSLGFLIAIALLLLYIITATQLFDAYYVNATEFLASLSPLTYIENSLGAYINHTSNGIVLLIIFIVLSIGFSTLNLFIYRTLKTDTKEA